MAYRGSSGPSRQMKSKRELGKCLKSEVQTLDSVVRSLDWPVFYLNSISILGTWRISLIPRASKPVHLIKLVSKVIWMKLTSEMKKLLHSSTPVYDQPIIHGSQIKVVRHVVNFTGHCAPTCVLLKPTSKSTSKRSVVIKCNNSMNSKMTWRNEKTESSKIWKAIFHRMHSCNVPLMWNLCHFLMIFNHFFMSNVRWRAGNS